MSNYDWSKPLFITGTTVSGVLAGKSCALDSLLHTSKQAAPSTTYALQPDTLTDLHLRLHIHHHY
jgi:hypothetical protein